MQKRPLGLSIIAWLSLIGGILSLVGGILVSTVIAYVLPITIEIEDLGQEVTEQDRQAIEMMTSPDFVDFMVRAGIMATAIGTSLIIMGVGLLKRTSWSWKFSVVLMIVLVGIDISSNFFDFIGVPSSLMQAYDIYSPQNLPVLIASSAVNIGIYLLVLYYLYRPHVRQYLMQP